MQQVCWVFFQIEGGSPGTTAILFTLAVYLVEGPRKGRHRRSRRRREPRNDWWPDALSKAENGSGVGSVELAESLLGVGGLGSSFDGSVGRVQFRTPFATTPGTADAAAAATAAAVAAAAAACATTPRTPARGAEENSFEGAMTRLAGAAELGTEALIYVRRSDVVQLVDFLIDNARAPVGVGLGAGVGARPAVTSPTLARLALVRRSRRRDLTPGTGRRACSPVPRGERPPSAYRRIGSPGFRGTRGGGGGGSSSSTGRRAASASPSSRAAQSRPASGGRALFQDSGVTTPPFRAAADANVSSSSRVTFRTRSPADSPSGSGGGITRRVRPGQEGKQRRLRQRVRSPSPPPGAGVAAAVASAARSSMGVLGMTPIALAKNCEAPLSAAAPNGDDPASTGKKKLAESSLLAARMQESIASRAMARAGKKRCTPVIQRKSGEREGTDFDDFWSSGWG